MVAFYRSMLSVYEVYVTAGESFMLAVNTHQLPSFVLLAPGILPCSNEAK